MGHYDDDYADDREQKRKAKNKRMKDLRKTLDDFKLKTIHASGEIPERFLNAFEDYGNWLDAQVKESRNE